MSTSAFWTASQPGFRFTDAEPGSERFFREIEEHRYALEPHIPDVARFDEWAGKDVLDVGCGLATDGSRFARAGAHYVGFDQAGVALELARQRFELEHLGGRFVEGDATQLPFPDGTFDLVWSHGVIHHIPETEQAVAEFHRVLRPGGTALLMVYHKNSLNYRFNILVVRRTLAAMLAVPGVARLLRRVASADGDLIARHRELLSAHGLRYLSDRRLFLSNNTDGPGNPLSKVYSREEAARIFRAAGFTETNTVVRYLNLRLYPKGDQLAATALARSLECRIGWHLYIQAVR
jgi:SAM-dependent methyltransferase